MIDRTPGVAVVALVMAMAALSACDRAAENNAATPAHLPAGTTAGPIHVPPPEQNISGVWLIQRYGPTIRSEGGGEPPFTEEGRTRYEANRAALAADPLANDESRRNCVPDGVPRILSSPYPFQILQTPGQVSIAYEINRVLRRIFLDTPQAAPELLEFVPYYSGYSVGHWEGDTLVIETAGFNDKTFLDNSGTPHSNRLQTVERVRRLDDKTLEIAVTITDPAIFSEPWNARFVYDLHPEVRLMDYVCGEPHRDISHISGVNVPN